MTAQRFCNSLLFVAYKSHLAPQSDRVRATGGEIECVRETGRQPAASDGGIYCSLQEWMVACCIHITKSRVDWIGLEEEDHQVEIEAI